MAITRGGVSIPVGADLSGFEKGLKTAEKLANKTASGIKKFALGKIWDTGSFVSGLKMSNKEFGRFIDKTNQAKEKYQDLIQLSEGLKKSDAWSQIGESAQQAVESAVASAKVEAEAYDRTLKHMGRGQRVKGLFEGFKKGFAGIGSVFAGFRRKTVQAGADFGSFLRRLAGIASVAVLVRKAYSMMQDGLGNLIKADSKTAASVNQLKGALTSLKNAMGAIAAPIINAVAPALTSIIKLFTKAANAVAHFMAAITGQKTVTIATESVADGVSSIGDSADSANDSAKELQRTLMGFDKINKLDSNNTGSSGGSGGSGFTTVPVEGFASDWADKFKQMWADADFTELGSILGTKLKNALDSINWDNIQTIGAKIGKSIATGLNGFFETEGLGTTIGESIAEALNTITITLDSFAVNFHWDSFGKFIGDEINGFFSTYDFKLTGKTASDFLNGILTSIINAVDTIDWEQIGRSIVEFIAGIDWKQLIVNALTLTDKIANGLFDMLKGAIKEAKKTLKQWIDSGKIWDDLFDISKKAIDLTVNLVKGAVDTILVTIFGEGSSTITWKKVGIKLVEFPAWLQKLFDGVANVEKKLMLSYGAPEWLVKVLDWLRENLTIKRDINMTVNIIEWAKKLLNWLLGDGKKTTDVEANVGLKKSGAWTTVGEWLKGKLNWGDDPNKPIGIEKSSGWQGYSVTSYLKDKWWGNTETTKAIGITKTSGWLGKSVTWWIKNKWWGNTETTKAIGITKSSGWIGKSVTWWIRNEWWGKTSTTQAVGIHKSKGWQGYSVTGYLAKNWLGKGFVEIGVSLFKWGWKSLKSFFGLSRGGMDTGHGFKLIPNFAKGGFVNKIPHGGMPKGSQLFWAREAGPELVGTIGGHTAVMNNDQIVSSVANGVARAISGIRFRMNATPQLILDKDTLSGNEPVQSDNSEIVALLKTLITELQKKEFTAELDGRIVSKSTVEYINNETRRTGISPILI